MTTNVQAPLLIASTVTTGLMAGLFAAYSYAIMPGLRMTDDRTFIGAMQRMNEAILNGWFAVCFGGALIFTILAAVVHRGAGDRAVLLWILIALGLYVATLAMTMGVNVPLNNQLADAGRPGHIADMAAVREAFEAKWTHWNVARAVTSTLALGSLSWALVLHGRR